MVRALDTKLKIAVAVADLVPIIIPDPVPFVIPCLVPFVIFGAQLLESLHGDILPLARLCLPLGDLGL